MQELPVAEPSASDRRSPRTKDPEARALETAAQLARDQALVNLLRADGFEGERFRRRYAGLIEKFADDSWNRFYDWLGPSGRMYSECWKVGRPVEREYRLQLTHHDRHELAVDTVSAGEQLFLDVGLRRGEWKSTKGATLQTYFNGACIREFPGVYRRWEKQKLESGDLLPEDRDGDDDEDASARLPSQEPGPERLAVLRDQTARVFALMPDGLLRELVQHRGSGLTQESAARRVGVTAKAAEMRLSTWRRRHVRDSATCDGEYGKEVY
jgi:hypothetical protein